MQGTIHKVVTYAHYVTQSIKANVCNELHAHATLLLMQILQRKISNVFLRINLE